MNKDCISEVYETPIQKINDDKNNIYIKRDDLLPFSFGGNKVRIAIEYFNDMQKKGKNAIIAYGNVRSNLCRVISNMAYKYNIPCYIIASFDEGEKEIETNNSILATSCNAFYIKCEKKDVSFTVEKTINDLKKQGYDPYYIYGDCYGKGNEAVPVNAYYKVYNEILKQEKDLNTSFDYIFLTTGTGMSQAGLICGQLDNDSDHKIIGISIARNSEVETLKIKEFVDCYFEDNNLNCVDKINIIDDYIYDGYGKFNEEIVSTITDMYKNEGIYLDTTYTGKAYNGMRKYIEEKGIKDKNILFIHTGGSPLFFDNINDVFKR